MNSFIIGVGSNIDAERNIPKAIDQLRKIGKVLSISEMIKTKPIGIHNQDDFLNGAIKFEANLSIQELVAKLKLIEDRIGRDRTRPKFGPREIDLDVVVYNNDIIDDDYYSRDFLKTSVDQIWTKK